MSHNVEMVHDITVRIIMVCIKVHVKMVYDITIHTKMVHNI